MTSHSAGRRTAFMTSRRTRVRSRRMRLPVAVPNLARSASGSSFAIDAKPPACKIGPAFLSMCCSSKQVTVAAGARFASFLASISPWVRFSMTNCLAARGPRSRASAAPPRARQVAVVHDQDAEFDTRGGKILSQIGDNGHQGDAGVRADIDQVGSVADAMASMTWSNSLRDAAPPLLSMSMRSARVLKNCARFPARSCEDWRRLRLRAPRARLRLVRGRSTICQLRPYPGLSEEVLSFRISFRSDRTRSSNSSRLKSSSDAATTVAAAAGALRSVDRANESFCFGSGARSRRFARPANRSSCCRTRLLIAEINAVSRRAVIGSRFTPGDALLRQRGGDCFPNHAFVRAIRGSVEERVR